MARLPLIVLKTLFYESNEEHYKVKEAYINDKLLLNIKQPNIWVNLLSQKNIYRFSRNIIRQDIKNDAAGANIYFKT